MQKRIASRLMGRLAILRFGRNASREKTNGGKNESSRRVGLPYSAVRRLRTDSVTSESTSSPRWLYTSVVISAMPL